MNTNKSDNEQSLVTEVGQVKEVKAGGMTMIVGVPERLTSIFGEIEEDDFDIPEDFQPPANEYEGWLGK